MLEEVNNVSDTRVMKREARLLNIICIVAVLAFIALAVINALTSPNFFTTDNLFVTVVCMLMALMFAVNPLLYLKDEGKLPLPFKKGRALKAEAATAGERVLPPSPPLLDAKGRAVPPDVRSMIAHMKQKEP